MSGINVLSDSLKVGSKADKTSNVKGRNATDSLENATVDFAAMLSGLTNIKADPMGQDSKTGQDLEEGLNPSRLVQNLGYGHFALSFLSQPVDLSHLPAGKEANSGNGVNQGTGEGLLQANNLWLTALDKLSLDSNEVFSTKGMTSQMSQGNNPGITELDKYRQVISELLVALSGKITDVSPEGTSLTLERGTGERQEIMKLVQSWLTATNTSISEGYSTEVQAVGNIEGNTPSQRVDFEVLEDATPSKMVNTLSGNKGAITDSTSEGVPYVLESVTREPLEMLKVAKSFEDLRQVVTRTVQELMQGTENSVIKPLLDSLTTEQGTSRDLSTKASSLITVFHQVLSQVQETNSPQGIMKEILQANGDKLEAAFNLPKGTNLVSETATEVHKDTVLPSDFKQKSAEIDLIHSKPLKNLQSVPSEEAVKGNLAESSELYDVKATQNQNANHGLGFDGKVATGSVADGKSVSIPVWEQISNAFREQVSNRNPELKEMDIQLHPADLGRIRIGLRWENGQVHLQVHASEAATGQIIQSQLTELRNTLTNQGVNCGMLQMGQQSRDQQNHNQNHQDQFRGTHDSYSIEIEDEELFPVVNSPTHGELNNRINVTA